jgi:hypothetical protein
MFSRHVRHGKHSGLRYACFLFILGLMTAAQAQEKLTLAYKAKAGQTMRYKAEGTLSLEAAGQKLTLELKQTEKVSVTGVSASGEVSYESSTEAYEMTINGQKMPDEERNEKTLVTVRPDRTLVSYKRDTTEPDPSKLSVRLYCATTPIYSSKPVGVGDKWTHEFQTDADMGIRAGVAEYELLAFEKAAGVDSAKIRIAYKESEGSPALTTRVTVWVEKTTGDSVKSETEVENVPFGEGPMTAMASGKINETRIEGNPLGETVPAGQAETKPEPKKEKTIDDTVKDYEKLPGLYTFYRKKESGRDTIYMEVREDQLDRLVMMEVTAATGTSDRVVAGTPINDLVFKFVRRDERLVLVTPNFKFRADDKSPISRAVRRSFADAYLEAFKIEAKQPDRKSLLINVSDLFRSDIAEISAAFSSGPSIPGLSVGGASYSMDRDKTLVSAIKPFPENVVVESEYHFTRSGSARSVQAMLSEADSPLADPRSIPLRVVYNLFELKDEGYKPRVADPRVGYFLTSYRDFSKDNVDENVVRYIYRWHLEKVDPKAAVSVPKKPIVFWLDNAIPIEYREAVRQGILDWNKAFLKAGFKDAIVVKQMPDDADWDHADMRYNTVRWVTSPEDGYAVALFRVNPITGQILNANITVDANIMRYTKLERRKIIAPASHFEDTDEALPPAAHRHDPIRCSYAQEAVQQAWFAHFALSFLSPAGMLPNEQEFARAFIRSIVTHEMGHIVGLRHNFVASTAFSLEQLRNRDFVAREGVTASVMDYTPFNIAALKHPGVPYWSSSVGRYDIWAVQYGYTPAANAPGAEKALLTKIASKSAQPGLAYQSDEIADQFDPCVTRNDLSSDPLAYWTRSLQVTRYLMLNLGKRSPKKGESYWTFTQQLNMLVNLYARAAALASHYVGGINVRGNFRGDPGEKPVLQPVPGAEQRKALRLLNAYIFAPNAFELPKDYYTKLAGNPFPDLIQSVLSGSKTDYPMLDTFAAIQGSALRRLFSPAVLQRVVNNEFKLRGSPDAFTLLELFNSVGWQVWSELSDGKPVSALRRQLQRAHLDTMIGMVVNQAAGVPADARMLAWDQLRSLKARLTSRGAPSDRYTRVHYAESLMRINRALDAQQVLSASEAPARSLLQMLLGEQTPARLPLR